MSAAIEITGLVKRYGDRDVLDGLELAVEEGSVFGFLGPNGAGKTTTLRILTGLARPTRGDVSVLGRPLADPATRAQVGFLPDVPGFYPWMTAEEFLRFAGSLFGLNGRVLDERVTGLLDLAGLSGVTTRVGGYSRGMKQRLGIAQALINAPRLLMLDEPTSALDPLGRREVLEMVASLAGRTTVFFSTHILADVERVCDSVAVLARGRVVAHGSLEEVVGAGRSGARLIVAVATGSAMLAERIAAAPWCTGVEPVAPDTLAVGVSDADAARVAIPALVAEAGLPLLRFDMEERSLEDVFVDLVDDADAHARDGVGVAAAAGAVSEGRRR